MNVDKYRQIESTLWNRLGLTTGEERIPLACTGTAVRVQVVGEGESVVIIHGGPNSGSTWAPMLEFFEGFRCYIVDRPGTGLSEDYVIPKSELQTVGDRFVADVLDGLGLDSAHVVASSFGGYLALRSAAATPDRVKRMVQMACPAFAPGMLTPKFMRMMRFAFLRWLVPKLPPSKRSNDDIMRQIGHGESLDAGRIPDHFFSWYMDMLRYTNTMKNELAMIGGGLVGGEFDPSLTLDDATLGSVGCPTLFLWGASDGFGGEEVAKELVAKMPDAKLELFPGFGHLPWLDDPETIAGKTMDFLNGQAVLGAP